MQTDISIDDLLLAIVDIKPKQRQSRTIAIQDTAHVEWIYSPSSIKCIGCGRIYHGQKFHAKINIFGPNRTYIQWCPECLDIELFWAHYGFKVDNIELSNSIEK